MNIVESVKSLGLSPAQFVVFGSGPLAVRGIRESSDIDLVATRKLFNETLAAGWEQKYFPEGELYLVRGNVEMFDNWNYNAYRPSVTRLIETADLFDEVAFARLEEVLKWKHAFGRPKDLADIVLINAYLRAHPHEQ